MDPIISALNEGADYNYTALLLGQRGSGKRTFRARFTEEAFKDSFESLDTKRDLGRVLSVRGESVRIRVRLDPLSYQNGTPYNGGAVSIYSGIRTIILLFDVNDESSFEFIKNWITESERYMRYQNVPKIAVGNKVDLDGQRVIDQERAKTFFSALGIEYHDVSSLNGEGVDQVFVRVAEGILDIIKPPPSNLDKEEKKEKKDGFFDKLFHRK
eukprot:TRINITY_DN8659_c0_g1_i2.p1 TRINITY_DN8659_c0_g1~~TRINITY_DN8659_c0_g1_i2.p1  ORF type:complete len:213 (-),score=48.70 TRINITY_DN8659_c0_g1_i2:30-668(-)